MSAEFGTRNSELRQRTFDFAIRTLPFAEALPKTDAGRTIARQLLRSGTAVGANYRAAKRARSTAEFIAKLGIVEEECDETIYWMELLLALDLLTKTRTDDLLKEANELLAIIIASIKTARRNRTK